MQWVTLWLHVSTINGHHQANKEHLLKVQKGIKQMFIIGLMMAVYSRNM